MPETFPLTFSMGFSWVGWWLFFFFGVGGVGELLATYSAHEGCFLGNCHISSRRGLCVPYTISLNKVVPSICRRDWFFSFFLSRFFSNKGSLLPSSTKVVQRKHYRLSNCTWKFSHVLSLRSLILFVKSEPDYQILPLLKNLKSTC